MFNIGDVVQIIDTFGGYNWPRGTGNVERVTKTQIHVRDSGGNLRKFRLKDHFQVGYAYPQLCLAIRAI